MSKHLYSSDIFFRVFIVQREQNRTHQKIYKLNLSIAFLYYTAISKIEQIFYTWVGLLTNSTPNSLNSWSWKNFRRKIVAWVICNGWEGALERQERSSIIQVEDDTCVKFKRCSDQIECYLALEKNPFSRKQNGPRKKIHLIWTVFFSYNKK